MALTTVPMRRLTSNSKEKLKTGDRRDVIYKVKFQNCHKCYMGQTGKKLAARMHEHKLFTKDMIRLAGLGMTLNLDTIYILDQANIGYSREFLEALHSSTNFINRYSELDQIYNLLKISVD